MAHRTFTQVAAASLALSVAALLAMVAFWHPSTPVRAATPERLAATIGKPLAASPAPTASAECLQAVTEVAAVVPTVPGGHWECWPFNPAIAAVGHAPPASPGLAVVRDTGTITQMRFVAAHEMAHRWQMDILHIEPTECDADDWAWAWGFEGIGYGCGWPTDSDFARLAERGLPMP